MTIKNKGKKKKKTEKATFDRLYEKPKWRNRELTLKCKLKCYVKPMKDPLGVSPSKGREFFLYLVWLPDSLY